MAYRQIIPDDRGPLWPVVRGSLAFLYLWWIGALVFDLVFVWHYYIRFSKLLDPLDEIHKRAPDPPESSPMPQRLSEA